MRLLSNKYPEDGGVFVSDQCFICEGKAAERCDEFPQVAYCSKGV